MKNIFLLRISFLLHKMINKDWSFAGYRKGNNFWGVDGTWDMKFWELSKELYKESDEVLFYW